MSAPAIFPVAGPAGEVDGLQVSTFQTVIFDFKRKTVTAKTIRSSGANVQLRLRPL